MPISTIHDSAVADAELSPGPRPPPPASTGLPGKGRLRRVGAGLLLLGIALFWVGSSYGLTGPFYYGHYGYHGGSYATWARGTLRHHTIYPVNEPGFAPPEPRTYYIHHPVFTHQLVTLTFALFGEHEWSVRLGALIPSFASLLLASAIAWRYLGPLSGGGAAVVFALVPVNIWYESHIDQGFPSIAFLLGFFWFYLAWLRGGTWRLGLAALGCEFMAGNFEWSPYFAFPAIFAHVIATAVRRRGRFLAFAALHPLTVILPLALHFWLVYRADLLTDLRAAYGNRTSEIGYAVFARAMRDYANTLFGPALLLAMGSWLLLVTVRCLRGRGRSFDLVGVTFAFALITYMHVFKTAVVTHAYRQLYGNVWATLAVADWIAQGLLWGRMFFSPWRFSPWRPLRRLSGTVVAVCVLATVTLSTLPVSWAGLLESRLHGGVPMWKTFNPDLRQTAFAIELERTTGTDDTLYFHPAFAFPPPRRMDWAFYYDRDLHRWASMRDLLALSPAQSRHAVVVFFPEQLQGDDLRAFSQLADHHRVWQVDDLAALDLRAPGDARDGFRLAPVDRSAASALRRWLEGPYPFPRLIPDHAIQARLVARIAEGARLAAPARFTGRPGVGPSPASRDEASGSMPKPTAPRARVLPRPARRAPVARP